MTSLGWFNQIEIYSPVESVLLIETADLSSKNVLKFELQLYALSESTAFCSIQVVPFTLISILATDYIQKRRGQAP